MAFFSLDILTPHGDYEKTVLPPTMTGPYPEEPSHPLPEDDCLFKFPDHELTFQENQL